MGIVTTAEAWPAARRPAIHQAAARRFGIVRATTCPGRLCVLPAAVIRLCPPAGLDPDLVVVHMDRIGGRKFPDPLLTGEIQPSGAALVDPARNRTAYRRLPPYRLHFRHRPDPRSAALSRSRRCP